ncbi:MAG: hypothetical protein PVI30_12420 [Myxococcales bacterium]
MPSEALGEILSAYRDAVSSAAPRMLGLALLAPAALLIHRVAMRGRSTSPGAARWAAHLFVAVAVVVGLALCMRRVACFDDAYISFRYAQNLVDGHGLVFNPGERVEGYTNFLWTVLLALGIAVTKIEAPLLGIVGCLLCFAANLIVVHRLSLRLLPAGALPWPLAVGLLAVQQTFVSYGTTGLESQCASLLTDLGLLWLLRGPTARTRGIAGLWLILATLTRPDHALFYAAGSVVVVWQGVSGLLSSRPRGAADAVRRLAPTFLAYAAPFALYLAHLAFRVAYYGETLPNTYYAKLASEPYYAQGFVYAAVFYSSSHFWIVGLMWLAFVAFGPASAWPFRLFTLVAIAAYNIYVARVGGDFMHGRFYLSLMPLYALGAEQLVHSLARWRLAAGTAAAAVLLSTAVGVRLQDERSIRWHIADENSYYRVTQLMPVVVDHYNYNVGKLFGRMRAAGVEPLVATTSVGMVGYYSGLTIIDMYGLTDHHIARLPTRGRGRPGHERRDSLAYLRARGVDIARRVPPPAPYRDLARIRLGEDTGGRHWYLMHYDTELVNAMRAVSKDVEIRDVPRAIDRYIRRLKRGRRPKPDRVARDVAFFDEFYFAGGQDPERKSRLQAALAASGL